MSKENKNLMPEVVELLGVEIGEEFEVMLNNEIVQYRYVFRKEGCFLAGTDQLDDSILAGLLYGNNCYIVKTQPTLTPDEKIILKNINKEYKWIARDEDGTITVFKDKPIKEHDIWVTPEYNEFKPFNHLFQFIKWTDKEPHNIKELLGEE